MGFPLFAAVAATSSLVGSAFSISSSKRAARAANRQAALEAEREERVTAERLRQIDRDEQILRGETIASAAASGVKVGEGSVLEILADQQAEFFRERQVTEEVGASKVAGALQRGSYVADRVRSQGIASAFSGIGNAFDIAERYGIFSGFKKSG